MWNLKYDTNELTFKTERLTDTENRLEGARGGMDGEFGINRGKLVYIDWITSKVLRHSTEKYIQHPMINCNGKEHKKECIHIYVYAFSICVTESLCCTAEMNTKL